MTEQTGQTSPPEWYTNPPEWLKEPRRDRDRDRERSYDRDRAYDRDRDERDLVTAIRAMPEQVVNALREAIQGAQAQQQSTQENQQQQQKPPEQKEQKAGNDGGDTTPKEKLTFADRWFANQL